ncbi:MAG TPA: class III poly(R)-hydroxyalkanoic acid synthase subunit PhaE [Luteimonas sp.]|nr:class III poly(R)-hydroxyalkanoic acid synthase subunit PhaE [Luteimonas sp.]
MQDSRQGGSGIPGDFDALARQYWSAWGEALRAAAPGAARSGAQPWQEALDWWGRFAQGGRQDGNDALERFNAQARQWLGQMQQVAAQFAGQPASAADIAKAWKGAMESAGGNPFLDLLRGMRGPGLQGFEQWFEQASPYLEGLRNESLSWLRMPAFGFAREHQERWQQLALAMADYQQCTQAYDELMRQATRAAYAIFEDKLAEREEPGKQLQSARALFDLWVDAAEDAYAKVALSKAFRDAYGQLVDAQMRLRAGVQREVELASGLFGMPTRTEVDAAHRKIVELERQLRRLRDAAAAPGQARPAAKKTVARKTAARKAAARGKPA